MAPTCPRPLNHIAIGVSDIEAAIRWYEEVLGFRAFAGPFELAREADETGRIGDVLGPRFGRVKIAHLATGSGVGLELFEAIDPPHERREESIEFWKSGTFHFCVTDPDIEGLVDKIVATGGRQLSRIWDDRPLRANSAWSIARIPTARSSRSTRTATRSSRAGAPPNSPNPNRDLPGRASNGAGIRSDGRHILVLFGRRDESRKSLEERPWE